MFQKASRFNLVLLLVVGVFTLGIGTAIAADGQLDRTGWTAIASANGSWTSAFLDDDLDSRWHGSYQEVGKSIELDMKANQTFNLITLWSEPSPNDLPRGFEVYLAPDGEEAVYGDVVYTGGFPEGAGVGEIKFAKPQTARYIKIVLTANDSQFYFALHELYVGNK